MAPEILNTIVRHLWLYLSYWWNKVNFSSTRMPFDILYFVHIISSVIWINSHLSSSNVTAVSFFALIFILQLTRTTSSTDQWEKAKWTNKVVLLERWDDIWWHFIAYPGAANILDGPSSKFSHLLWIPCDRFCGTITNECQWQGIPNIETFA